MDEQDCSMFLYYTKIYLSPIEELKEQALLIPRLNRFLQLNLSKEINLLSFSLMPNHFHLEVVQFTRDGMIKFMRRLTTSYVMYFNKKYKRVGGLFQNRYKAVLIENDEFLLHLSRYIHSNPMKTNLPIDFTKFSSYPYYLGQKNASWIKPQEILGYFKNAQRQNLKDLSSYQSFVKDYNESSVEVLKDLILEED